MSAIETSVLVDVNSFRVLLLRHSRQLMCLCAMQIKLPDVMCTSDAGAVLANKVRQASVCDLPHSDTSTAVDSQSVATDCTAECMENQTGYCAVGHCGALPSVSSCPYCHPNFPSDVQKRSTFVTHWMCVVQCALRTHAIPPTVMI